jgi:hypothetical protein
LDCRIRARCADHDTMIRARYKIFISHSSVDEGVARLLERCVRHLGATPYLDVTHLETGLRISEAIRKEILCSSESLLIVSPSFIQSHWTSWELGVAEAGGLTISPLLHYLTPSEVQRDTKWQGLLAQRSLTELKSIDKYLLNLESRINRVSTSVAHPEDLHQWLADTLRDAHKMIDRLGEAKKIKASLDAKRKK